MQNTIWQRGTITNQMVDMDQKHPPNLAIQTHLGQREQYRIQFDNPTPPTPQHPPPLSPTHHHHFPSNCTTLTPPPHPTTPQKWFGEHFLLMSPQKSCFKIALICAICWPDLIRQWNIFSFYQKITIPSHCGIIIELLSFFGGLKYYSNSNRMPHCQSVNLTHISQQMPQWRVEWLFKKQ